MGYKQKDVKIHSKTIYSISEYLLSLLKPAPSSEKQQIPPILGWCTVNTQGKPQIYATKTCLKQSMKTSFQSNKKSQTAKWMLFFKIDNSGGVGRAGS